MLQRHRAPGIDPRPSETVKGFEHLKHEWVAVLCWLAEARVEYVVVGPVGEAIREGAGADGTVAIVPAPYHRNLDRLARALMAAHVRLRTGGDSDTAPVRFNAAALSTGEHWTLRCEATYDVDIEMFPAERYSELLYEAGRFEIASGCSVEVASHEDLGRCSHVRIAGVEPEIRVSRGPAVPQSSS
jgi:hypothetical protein